MVDREFLAEILNFPPELKIVGAQSEVRYGTTVIELVVEHPKAPDSMNGEPLPVLMPVMETVRQQVVRVLRIEGLTE